MKKFAVLIALMCSACATVFSGTTQTINVAVQESENHNNLDNAVCRVTDGSGGVYSINSSPATVTVSRANGSVIINCKKDGYKQVNTMVGDSFNPVTLVNVIFWPGFIVDAVSGSYKKYPSHYVVIMDKK